MNHIDLGNDASNIITKASMELGISGVKLTGKLAFKLLELYLEKSKDNLKFASGLMDLDKLIKSGEELQTVKLSNGRLDEFKDKAEQFKIAYAVVPDEIKSTIIFKASQVPFINNIMKEFVDKEKLEQVGQEKIDEVYKLFKDHIDIPEVGETVYRHEIEVDKDKVKPMNEILEKSGFKNDISLSDMNGDKATVQFKVPEEQKDKAVALIDQLKEKGLEELLKLSKELDSIDKQKQNKEVKKNDNKEKVSKVKNEGKSKADDKSKSLDEVIKDAKSDINKNTDKAMKKIGKILDSEKTLDDIIKEAKEEAKLRNANANKTPTKEKSVKTKEKVEIEKE